MSEPVDVANWPLAWATEMSRKFAGGIAHTFILDGAVDDYVHDDPVRLVPYLGQLLSANHGNAENAGHRDRLLVRWDCSSGLRFGTAQMRKEFAKAAGLENRMAQFEEGKKFLPAPQEAFPAIETALLHPSLRRRMAVIIEQPEYVWPNSPTSQLHDAERVGLATLRRWASESEFAQAGQLIMLVTRTATDLHPDLLSASASIERVTIPYPSVHDRERFIVGSLARRDASLEEGMSPQMMAGMTGGLTRRLTEDIILRAQHEDRPVSYTLIRDRRDQVIRGEFGDLIEILEPRFGLDRVGGMKEVKKYLYQAIIGPLAGQSTRERMPNGVLLAGPPGTGKTLLVTALARDAGVAVVKLNAGRLLGEYVGTSERNLERALACIRSLSPVLVMMDEIEQQFQRGTGDGDSGVGRRLFGRLLEEMSGAHERKRGDVVWFAATNRIDLVDPALRRPGRFDKIVPILPPTPEERWEILMSKITPAAQPTQPEYAEILRLTHMYTGADIDAVVMKAADLAAFAGRDGQVLCTDIIQALSLLRRTSGGDVDQMLRAALEFCNDLELIPDAWRATVEAMTQPPAQS